MLHSAIYINLYFIEANKKWKNNSMLKKLSVSLVLLASVNFAACDNNELRKRSN